MLRRLISEGQDMLRYRPIALENTNLSRVANVALQERLSINDDSKQLDNSLKDLMPTTTLSRDNIDKWIRQEHSMVNAIQVGHSKSVLKRLNLQYSLYRLRRRGCSIIRTHPALQRGYVRSRGKYRKKSKRRVKPKALPIGKVVAMKKYHIMKDGTYRLRILYKVRHQGLERVAIRYQDSLIPL